LLLALLSIGTAGSLARAAPPGSGSVKQAVVQISSARTSSDLHVLTLTGVILAKPPGILTALHGVAGMGSISAKTAKSSTSAIQTVFPDLLIQSVDIKSDLALLYSTALSGAIERGDVHAFTTAEHPRNGTQLLLAGWKRAQPIQTDQDLRLMRKDHWFGLIPEDHEHQAVITALKDRQSPAESEEMLLLQADIQPGLSGGPLLDEQGRVVGIAVGSIADTGNGFAAMVSPKILEQLAPNTGQTKKAIEKLGLMPLADVLRAFESSRVGNTEQDRWELLLERLPESDRVAARSLSTVDRESWTKLDSDQVRRAYLRLSVEEQSWFLGLTADQQVTVSCLHAPQQRVMWRKLSASGQVAALALAHENPSALRQVLAGEDLAAAEVALTKSLTHAPPLEIVFPGENGILRGPVVVRGRVAGESVLRATVNGVVAQVAGADFSAVVPFNSDGIVELEVVAVLSGDRICDATRDIVIDNTSPEIVLTWPITAEAETDLQEATLTGAVLDASPVSLTLNGAPLPVDLNGKFSVGMRFGLPGERTVVDLIGTDSVGNPPSNLRRTIIPYRYSADDIVVSEGRSIQAAVDAAPVPTTIVVMPGNHWGGVVLKSGIALQGLQRPDKPCRLVHPRTTCACIMALDCRYCSVRGFELDRGPEWFQLPALGVGFSWGQDERRAKVIETVAGSPAERVGLRRTDEVVSVGGVQIKFGPHEAVYRVAAMGVGRQFLLGIAGAAGARTVPVQAELYNGIVAGATGVAAVNSEVSVENCYVHGFFIGLHALGGPWSPTASQLQCSENAMGIEVDCGARGNYQECVLEANQQGISVCGAGTEPRLIMNHVRRNSEWGVVW
jgi:S1-C subfamily serine protease